MVLHLVRILFMVVVMALSFPFAFREEVVTKGIFYAISVYMLGPAIFAFLFVLVDMFWRRKRLGGLSGLFFGVLAGLLFSYAMNKVVEMFALIFFSVSQPSVHPTVQWVCYLMDAAVVFLCVTIVLQTKDDFRFVIPYVEFSRQAKGSRPWLLDTSVIVDGRIADMADTGILESRLIVPRFILDELQSIADSDDRLKRNRGRRGLDILNRLRTNEKLDVEIYDTRIPAVEKIDEVDAKLVALCEHLDGRVVTNDYNLNKVARLRDVEVININDLANSLKPVVLPGETMRLKVIKAGEEPGQGVGYLDDGTMVVVEGGRDHIGREIGITVTSALQTSAGKMIFGKVC